MYHSWEQSLLLLGLFAALTKTSPSASGSGNLFAVCGVYAARRDHYQRRRSDEDYDFETRYCTCKPSKENIFDHSSDRSPPILPSKYS